MPTINRASTPVPPDLGVRDMVFRRRRRRRAVVVPLVALVILLGAGLVGAGVIRAQARAPRRLPSQIPSAATADRTGFTVSSGTVRVDMYIDYLCPECRRLDSALSADLAQLQTSGAVSVVYHPVAFLIDRSAPTGYSLRAAAAAACAAQAGHFAPYSALLFARQPAENGSGLAVDALVALGRPAGITGGASAAFERCIRSGTFRQWATYVTDVAAARGVTVTPTVVVADQRVDVNGSDPGQALTEAVIRARR